MSKNRQCVFGLWDVEPDFVLWTDMNCRRIFFDVAPSGNVTRTCAICIRADLNDNPNQKVLWYTNLRHKADNLLVPSAENILDKLGVDNQCLGQVMLCIQTTKHQDLLKDNQRIKKKCTNLMKFPMD